MIKLISKHQDGNIISPEKLALSRANKLYNNYCLSKEVEISIPMTMWYNTRRFFKDYVSDWISAGSSNCMLTASQWVDPHNALARSASLWYSPEKYGYTQIPQDTAIPGNLVIAKNPNNEVYHTMMINGFADKDYQFNFDGKLYPVKKGDIMVNYSRGGDSPNNLRTNIPLSVYIANSEGKTDTKYFRYNYPNSILLDNVTVSYDKKKGANN